MKKIILVILFFILTSCIPRELVIVDPIIEYGEYRNKKILLLNIGCQDAILPIELENLSRNILYRSLQKLKSIEFAPYDIPQKELNIDLTENNLKQIGTKYEADIIITGQINYYQEWHGKKKQIPSIYFYTPPLDKNIKTDTDLIEALIKITVFFIDGKNGKIIWTRVLEKGDIEPVDDSATFLSENKISLSSTPEERNIAREKLRQRILNDIMKILVNDLMPYYDYR